LHTLIKRLALLAALIFANVGALAQSFPLLGQIAGNSPRDVIVLPPGGGSAVSLGDTPVDTVVDMNSIPAGNLLGLGSPATVSSYRGRDNIAGGRDEVSSLSGVQLCDDDDGDGVCNQEDYCADTPPQAIIMPSGCHLSPDVPLELVGVFFDFNGAILRPESYEILDRVVALLSQQDTEIVEIGGHTDSRGSQDANAKISRDRAKAVYAYLIKRGIAAYRLTYKGYASSQPVAPNRQVNGRDNADGRARNRRVDMRVVQDLGTLQKQSQ
jgi:outer membrane protein OmpA-like peptidoglycan-associated protein